MNPIKNESGPPAADPYVPTPILTGEQLTAGELLLRPPTDLRAIAAGQRMVIYALLGGMALSFVPYGAGLVGLVWQVVSVVNLARPLKLKNVWLWGIGTAVPLLGIIVLLIINARATAALRAAGVRVGLLGARDRDIPAA